jgi:hypothetical protein
MGNSFNTIASDPHAQSAAADLSATPTAASKLPHARDDPSSNLDEQVRAVKRQRTTAIAVAQASSELRPGLVEGATASDCFKALHAFVTLAELGHPAPVQQARQLLVTLQGIFAGYWIGNTFDSLSGVAQSMCSKLRPANLPLLRQLFDELLSGEPSVTLWPFVSALLTSCDGKLPSATRAQYIEILRAEFSKGIGRGDQRSLMLTLIRALMQCGMDIDQPNAVGDTLLLECFNALYPNYAEELLQPLVSLGATPWVSNSVTKRTLLHIWMDKNRCDIVWNILLERTPWADLLPLLDWWAADDKGRTPLQMAQEKAWAPFHPHSNYEANVEAAIAVTELLPALLQPWKQTERPLFVQSLVEHASLCTDVAAGAELRRWTGARMSSRMHSASHYWMSLLLSNCWKLKRQGDVSAGSAITSFASQRIDV